MTLIGETEPEIKKDILNGNQRISIDMLESLASATTEEIEKVVNEIKTGEFISRAPRGSGTDKKADNPINLPIPSNETNSYLLPELKKLNNVINNFASSFNNMLKEINSNDPAPLKEVLRSYISELEDLYRNL